MGIAYDADKVREHLIKERVWPGGSADEAGVKSARDWWIGLLKQITYGVNDHPWDDTDDMDDAKREITDIAVNECVSRARSMRAVLLLLHLSDIGDLDVSDEVEIRLHDNLRGGGDGTRGIFPRSGETYDDPDYLARKQEAQLKRSEEITELLKLKSITEIYLEAAAASVARPWCEAQVKRALTQWVCERCEETFATENQAESDECDGAECDVHDDGEECEAAEGVLHAHDCSFPHSLVRNDSE